MMKNNNTFLICFLLLSFMNAFFASAADQVITWKKEAQEIDLYSDEALKIQWTGTHDVWLHSAEGCTGGGSKKVPEANSNWSATAGNILVGTHYFSCRVGTHCEENMTLKVTAIAGSRPAATDATDTTDTTTTSTYSSAKKSTPFATGFAVLAAVSALFC
jgi:hypothetical protein